MYISLFCTHYHSFRARFPRIAVVALASSSFTLNTGALRAVTRMSLRSLSTLGVAVLPVNVDKWQEMPEVERIPYLMRMMPKDATDERNCCDFVV